MRQQTDFHHLLEQSAADSAHKELTFMLQVNKEEASTFLELASLKTYINDACWSVTLWEAKKHCRRSRNRESHMTIVQHRVAYYDI
jgi:hypothetical protein